MPRLRLAGSTLGVSPNSHQPVPPQIGGEVHALGRATIFDGLELWPDMQARAAAEQMAADEALLLLARAPLLRVYHWAGPAVTFGYFQRWDEVAPMVAGRDVSRRWTGGGIVEHGDDLTYALVVPTGSWEGGTGAVRSWYRIVHTALMESMAGAGVACMSLADPSGPATRGGACFDQPSAADVLGGSEKVAGAALRRTKHGVLWQGSVRVATRLRREVVQAFAGRLARRVRIVGEPEGFTDSCDGVMRKYTSAGWNLLR